jgi:hypothetical protein
LFLPCREGDVPVAAGKLDPARTVERVRNQSGHLSFNLPESNGIAHNDNVPTDGSESSGIAFRHERSLAPNDTPIPAGLLIQVHGSRGQIAKRISMAERHGSYRSHEVVLPKQITPVERRTAADG